MLRYIERNPLRAGLVERAEAWPWSSLRWLAAPEQGPVRLEPGTVPRGTLWVEGVNAVTADIDLDDHSTIGVPGSPVWGVRMDVGDGEGSGFGIQPSSSGTAER